MSRIFVYVSKEVEREIEKYQKEKGYLKVQDAVRDILGEWYAGRMEPKE